MAEPYETECEGKTIRVTTSLNSADLFITIQDDDKRIHAKVSGISEIIRLAHWVLDVIPFSGLEYKG
jgi:hypothetical protein